jgi:hypothetical protein
MAAELRDYMVTNTEFVVRSMWGSNFEPEVGPPPRLQEIDGPLYFWNPQSDKFEMARVFNVVLPSL